MPMNQDDLTGGLIQFVDPEGIGAEVGIEPGDRLLSINGHPLRDVIDYRYYGDEDQLLLVIERQGQQYDIDIERDDDESLGIEFTEITFDGLRNCQNHCPFCFVQQMPRGMRPSLYVHDDDYRYSFLLGNFITLTNLSETDWQRITEQHLSPLYVSVHATDLALRRELLGNPSAPDIVAQLARLGRAGIQVHTQIVLTPGLNDGETLERTIQDLAALWPTVQTLAVVPVGLTRFQRNLLAPFGADDAQAALTIVDRWAPALRQRLGATWLYPSDELLLQAGHARAIPEAAFYDTDAQRENGVGLVRELLDDWQDFREDLDPKAIWPQRITLVTGTLMAPLLAELANDLAQRTGMVCDVIGVENRFFGEYVTVAGLLTGQDVLGALEDIDLGERLFVPRSMFDQTGDLTLDDVPLEQFERQLGLPVYPVSTLSEIVALCLMADCG